MALNLLLPRLDLTGDPPASATITIAGIMGLHLRPDLTSIFSGSVKFYLMDKETETRPERSGSLSQLSKWGLGIMASIVTQIQPFLAGGMFPALALGQPGGLAPHLHPHPGHSSGLALSVVRSLGFL